MKFFAREFSKKEYDTFSAIAVSASQVTLGVGYASLFIAPLDFMKGWVILISFTFTVFLWWIAWSATKESEE